MLNIILLVFFTIVGLAGLIYKVDSGVFVGLSLIPWQLIRIKVNKLLNIGSIVITTIAGCIFFIYLKSWLLLILFLFIEIYNYWGYIRAKKREEEDWK